MYGDLSDVPFRPLLDQLQAQTGILSLRDGHGHRYRIGLHQGTVQTLHLDAILLSQRRQVVAALALLLHSQQGHFAFVPCPLADLGPDTTPMNLQRLLESAAQEAAQPASAAPKHQGLPCPQTPFVQVDRPAVYQLPADLQDHWAALCLLLPVQGQGQGLSAQQLAEQLGASVGQLRVRLFRLQEAGLVIPTAHATEPHFAHQHAAQPHSQPPTVQQVASSGFIQPPAQSGCSNTEPVSFEPVPTVYLRQPNWTPLPPEMLN